MCFAPQRRTLFRHLNFQKWSKVGVFCTCLLGNVLRTTTACTFSTSKLPKVVRRWCVLYMFTWKCASHHNGVHFFDISTSKSGPTLVCFVHFDLEMCFAPQRRAIFILWPAGRTRRFSEVTFRPSGAPNHWINIVNCDFPTFSRTCIFLLPTLSLLWPSHFWTSPLWLFPPLLHKSLLTSHSWLLTLLHIVGSLTSKLPSMIYYTQDISVTGGAPLRNREVGATQVGGEGLEFQGSSWESVKCLGIPSCKPSKPWTITVETMENYGKSPCAMGKSIINRP